MHPLKPYRSRGVGSQALKVVLDAAASHQKPAIAHIYLHVQVSNHDAKRFYERHGFKELRVHSDYYRKLQPRDAWVLEKSIGEVADGVVA